MSEVWNLLVFDVEGPAAVRVVIEDQVQHRSIMHPCLACSHAYVRLIDFCITQLQA